LLGKKYIEKAQCNQYIAQKETSLHFELEVAFTVLASELTSTYTSFNFPFIVRDAHIFLLA